MSCLWDPKHKVTSKTRHRQSSAVCATVPCGHLLSWPWFCRQSHRIAVSTGVPPQGTADVQRGLPKTRQAPSGLGDSVVQGHGVTAQKQLLLPHANLLFSCSAPFSNSSSHSSFLPSLLLPGLSPHHAITTPLLEFSFSPHLWQLFPRIAACPGCPGCQLSSSLCCHFSFHPSCHSSRAENSPGTHPCRTDNPSRPREPQGSFERGVQTLPKGRKSPKEIPAAAGSGWGAGAAGLGQHRNVGRHKGGLLFLRSPSPRHSSGKHCSPEPLESFRLHREHTALMSPGCHQHPL